jgi:predicted Fe-S protein YdhL (DUF1289 family)
MMDETRPARPDRAARRRDPIRMYKDLLAARVPDALAARYAPPSPCISVCKIAPETGLCYGCLRTLEEIGAWSNSEDEDKHAVWVKIAQRLEASP